MKIRNIINRIIYPKTYSSEIYIKNLKKKGILIGENCYIYAPYTVNIDVARPWLLSIGNNVVITKGVSILTHDYSHTVIRKKYGENIGDAQPVTIRNNVFIGMDSIILMGADIGNNVIIGAKAVVRGHVPDNVVIAGNPAKIVCTLEEYYQRRKDKQVSRAVKNVLLCRERLKRNPTLNEMCSAYAWMYLPRTKQSIEKYKDLFELPGESREDLIENFLNGKSEFDTYEEFLDQISDIQEELR